MDKHTVNAKAFEITTTVYVSLGSVIFLKMFFQEVYMLNKAAAFNWSKIQ